MLKLNLILSAYLMSLRIHKFDMAQCFPRRWAKFNNLTDESAMAKVKPKKKTKIIQSPFANYWGKKNYIILISGIFIILLGFILMSQSPWDNTLSLTISPIVLLIAYVVIIPLSILYKNKSNSSEENASSKS